MKSKILIVEDEEPIREMTSYALIRAGFACDEAEDVVQAQRKIAAAPPSLILLDWMLPGVSGVDYVYRLRNDDATRHIPIIMLTAKGEEVDKIQALDIGADDHISKPFSVKELVARIKAVLRRCTDHAAAPILAVDGLVLNMEDYRVSAHGQNVKVSRMEFKLLQFFIEHAERVYNRPQLLAMVWGENVYVEERTVDVHIRRLRKILAPFGFDKYIQTVRGVGYRFSKN